MKYPAKIYSQALASVILEKQTEAEKEKAVFNMINLLKKNGGEKEIKKIIGLTQEILAKKAGNKFIIFETARDLSENGRKIITEIVKKGDLVEKRINPEIIAGIKIIINNEMELDNTILRKINKIF